MSTETNADPNSDIPNEWEGNHMLVETIETSNSETIGSLSNEYGSTEIEFVPTDNCFHSIFGSETPDWTQKPTKTEKDTLSEDARTQVSSSSCGASETKPLTPPDKKPFISHEQYQSALKAKIKCPNCYFTTINKGNLKLHMRKHEKPDGYIYTCDICDFKSIYKNSMKKHRARKHEARNEPKRRKK